MPLVINTNVAALNSQRQLVKSGDDMAQAMERLSSGKRVNSAADDAAGLAIANRMTSQIKGLDQAVRNANDGISMIQTAEGALDETTNILQRMRELSIQSANGIYSDADRSTLDAEVQQLKTELDRIAETTSFNGQPLLDGSLKDVDLQVGAMANQVVTMEIGSFSTSSLGGSSGDIVGSSAVNGLADLTTAFTATGDITINDTAITAIDHTAPETDTINEILASMNEDLDGKGVEVSTLVSVEATSVGTGLLRGGTDTLSISVIDGDGNTQAYVISDTEDMKDLVAKINAETSVEASINEDGKLVLSQENVQSITIVDSTTNPDNNASGLADATTNFSLVLTDTSADKKGIKVEIAATTTAAEMAALGLNVQDDGGALQGATVDANALTEGDLILNGVPVGAIVPAAATATAKATATIDAINEISEQTGIVAYAGTAADSIALRSADGTEFSIEAGNGLTAAQLFTSIGLTEQNALSGVGSIASVSIATAEGAQKAIEIVDRALEQINATRADLGAANNRLDFTISNLMNVSENTSASRSRIMDADFAAETANLSRAQVLQQASQAMLAQANAKPQQVLQLLNG
ncbi:flagellin [Aestuariicella sp. G3-2]|uniref:flagellin N-terminal helical domain-containing protein n=1 Tax=Pseudomaricurvus albidus TaxID=2842452 RepID=UPI001C0B9A56|nr:flagellin [Aestuariicella albida]MBU3071160.1 flagellin [Aestuariicella albida]